MSGLARLLIAAIIGGVFAFVAPIAGVMAASQEIIGFLALLMAGLLPAMTLTSTILRGTGFSSRRIEEYGGALGQQMLFWAVLFASALIATLGIVGAKVFSANGVTFVLQLRGAAFDQSDAARIFLVVAGMGTGVVFQRLRPAYLGLRSLLSLSIQLAKAEALNGDRERRELLIKQSEELGADDPYSVS